MTILQKLKRLREIKGLSQQQVADALFTTQSTLSNIENGKTRLDVAFFLKLAEFYNVELRELLLEYNPVMKNNVENNSRVASQADILNAANLELVQALKDQLSKKDKQIEQLLSFIQQQSTS
ncbi:MAG: helix-turn-helix domain-containing protein [Bacteroidetes bacterium]|nr:helix-turn-helix domain-containing protein [Bacteroidota bacterium]